MRPNSSEATDPGAADLAECRALLRGGSRSFHAASRLLPRRVRAPAAALYAFCRLADDAIDTPGAGPVALESLHARLAAAYRGDPAPIAADRALAAVLARHAIPRALPEALLEGFAWDAEARQYDDLAALQDYAARVAGTVGAMMALLMGADDAATLARASELGVAMQLTNIARDVGEDASAGRLYLPLDWLREAGIEPQAWLAQPRFDAALAGVIARLLAAAETLYARAAPGIARLPHGCRPAIRAAAALYAEIGRAVMQPGHDPVRRRAVVPGRRKLVLLARAVLPAKARETPLASPLPAVRFLVEAAARPPRAASPTLWQRADQRLAWLIALFDRLERDAFELRLRRPAPSPGHPFRYTDVGARAGAD